MSNRQSQVYLSIDDKYRYGLESFTYQYVEIITYKSIVSSYLMIDWFHNTSTHITIIFSTLFIFEVRTYYAD